MVGWCSSINFNTGGARQSQSGISMIAGQFPDPWIFSLGLSVMPLMSAQGSLRVLVGQNRLELGPTKNPLHLLYTSSSRMLENTGLTSFTHYHGRSRDCAKVGHRTSCVWDQARIYIRTQSSVIKVRGPDCRRSGAGVLNIKDVSFNVRDSITGLCSLHRRLGTTLGVSYSLPFPRLSNVGGGGS